MAVSAEAAAVLVITGRVLSAVQMFADRVGTAVFAGIAHTAYSKRNIPVLREVITVSTVLIGMGIAFSLAFSESVITLWVGPNLFGGRVLLLLLALSIFMSSRKELISALLIALGHTRDASRWTVAEAVIRVTMLVGFVSVFGMPGIPLAGAMASLITLAGLSRLLLQSCGGTWEMLFTPGLTSFILSMLFGILFSWIIPHAGGWWEFSARAIPFCSLLLLASMFDSEWIGATKKTGDEIVTALGLRRSLGGMAK